MRRWIGSFFGLFVLAGALWIVLTPVDPEIDIGEATATPLGRDGVGVAMTFTNNGGPDRLIGASSPMAARTMLHNPDLEGIGAPIASGTTSFALDAAHLRLADLQGQLEDGLLIPLTLTFAEAGEKTLKARFISADQMIAMSGLSQTDETRPGAEHGEHTGAGIDAGQPAPTLNLTVDQAQIGWHVRTEIRNFTFDRDAADGPHQAGHGHAHLYVGGMKVGRMFGTEGRIGALPPGSHTVRVMLYSNDHRKLLVDGRPVTATARVTAR